MDLSTSKYGHLKYTVKLADIVGLGAALTGDITLDTLPPGVLIVGQYIKASTTVSGGAIATATARLKLNSTAIGTAAVNVFTGAGNDPANAVDVTVSGTAAGSLSTSANVLKLTLTTTTGNLNAATQGQIDVIVNYTVLAP